MELNHFVVVLIQDLLDLVKFVLLEATEMLNRIAHCKVEDLISIAQDFHHLQPRGKISLKNLSFQCFDNNYVIYNILIESYKI